MPRPIKTKTREPFTLRIRQVTREYANQMNALTDGMKYFMKEEAAEQLKDRLKVASMDTIKKIDVIATKKGTQVTLRYSMPPSFHALNKGRKPGELDPKKRKDVNEIKRWLKAKKKLFGAGFKEFSHVELESRRQQGNIRKGLRYYKITKRKKTKTMTDLEAAKMITGKIQVFGTRSSRFKFIGLYKTKRKNKDDIYVELNKPRYIKYEKLISTTIMESVNRKMEQSLKELKDDKPLTIRFQDTDTGKTTVRTFSNMDAMTNVENLVLELEEEFKKIFIYFRHHAQGSAVRKRAKYEQNKFGEYEFEEYEDIKSKGLAPKTRTGKVEAVGRTRERAINIFMGNNKLTEYKTVFDVLKGNNLLNAIPSVVPTRAKNLIYKMLRRMTIDELEGTIAKTKTADDSYILSEIGVLGIDEIQHNIEMKDASEKAAEAYDKSVINKEQIRLADWAKYIDKLVKIARRQK